MNESNFASLSSGLLARKGQAKPAMRPQLYKFAEDDDLGWNDMGSEMLTPEQKQALMPNAPTGFSAGENTHQFSPQEAAVAFDDMPTPPTEDGVCDDGGKGGDTRPDPTSAKDASVKDRAGAQDERSVEDKVAEVLAKHAGSKPVESGKPAESADHRHVDAKSDGAPKTARPRLAAVPASPVKRPRAAAGSKSKAAFTLRLEAERHLKLRLACAYSHKSAQALVTAALDEYLVKHFPDAVKGAPKAVAG